MKYSQIRNLDISNGLGVGVSLFVQGCPFHCYNCFNPETWNFNGGKEWTEETRKQFLTLIDRPYIKRVSFLGGECLAEQNLDDVLSLIKEIRLSYPEKTIWLYTGYNVDIDQFKITLPNNKIIYKPTLITKNDDSILSTVRSEILNNVDIIIDGEYIDEQRDITLKWRGSSNQRVIDTKQSLAQNEIILYCD